MKKFIKRTTKEYTHDEKGFLVKEVETVEEYEVEVANGGLVSSGTVSVDTSGTKIDSIKPYRKAQGIPPYRTTEPYEARFDTEGAKVTGKLTYNGQEVTLPQHTINNIVSQVKAKLDSELKNNVRTMPYRPNKAF